MSPPVSGRNGRDLTGTIHGLTTKNTKKKGFTLTRLPQVDQQPKLAGVPEGLITTTLDSLKIGQFGEIIAISKACHGQQRRRLMDFGILPGTDISVEMESLGGDPIAYFIRGTTIALRRDQAKMIHIKPVMEN